MGIPISQLDHATRARLGIGKKKSAPRGMNGLEKEYAEHLDFLIRARVVRRWWFESFKVKLANGAWFTPDFLVQSEYGAIAFHETKGGFFREAAKVRIKVASDKYPFFDWFIVRKVGADWVKEHV